MYMECIICGANAYPCTICFSFRLSAKRMCQLNGHYAVFLKRKNPFLMQPEQMKALGRRIHWAFSAIRNRLLLRNRKMFVIFVCCIPISTHPLIYLIFWKSKSCHSETTMLRITASAPCPLPSFGVASRTVSVCCRRLSSSAART